LKQTRKFALIASFFEKKQHPFLPKSGQIWVFLIFNCEFRAKVEKKCQSFWLIGRRHIVLVIDLGYK
jgi:hypothetical protein